jgi:hypothetical protein
MLQPHHSSVKMQDAIMMNQPALGNYSASNSPMIMSRLKDLGVLDGIPNFHGDMQKRKWTSESNLDQSQIWLGRDPEAPKLSPRMPVDPEGASKQYLFLRLLQEITQAETSKWNDVHDVKVHSENHLSAAAFRHDRNASTSPSDHAMSEEQHAPELARSPDMELKRTGSLSSEDVEDLVRSGRGRSQSRNNKNFTVSKNLVSERKRRKKLNDGLYSLRALVPKISKMDKASIVGDAIEHVKELQQQIETIELEISEMENNCNYSAKLDVDEDSGASKLSETGEPATAATATVTEVLDVACKLTSESSPRTDNVTKVATTVDDSMSLADPQSPASSGEPKKILKLDVSKLDEQMFQLQISCQKGPGVLVRLTQALESLDIEVLNAYHTYFQESILNTFIVQAENLDMKEAEDVIRTLLGAATEHGLAMQS